VSLSLKESQAIAGIADHLYSFLPGTPHPYANQGISFPGIAAKLGLGQYWSGGSKRPALTQLLSATLDRERGRFCALVTEIVRQGITYRQQKEPLVREDVERLNELVLKVGFKIPELYDAAFLDGLPRRAGKPADDARVLPVAAAMLGAFQKNLLEVSTLPAQQRGFAFETFLNGLFEAYKLAPRESFRLLGEQIAAFNLTARPTWRRPGGARCRPTRRIF